MPTLYTIGQLNPIDRGWRGLDGPNIVLAHYPQENGEHPHLHPQANRHNEEASSSRDRCLAPFSLWSSDHIYTHTWCCLWLSVVAGVSPFQLSQAIEHGRMGHGHTPFVKVLPQRSTRPTRAAAGVQCCC